MKWEPQGDYEAAYRSAVSGRIKYKEKIKFVEMIVFFCMQQISLQRMIMTLYLICYI